MLLRQKEFTQRSAFTLMEIIVVVTIILILAGSAVFVFTGVLDKSYEQRAYMDVKSIEKACGIYYTSHHFYPQSVQVLTERDEFGNAALLDDKVLLDPWRQPYVIDGSTHPKTGIPHIYSQGPPGKNKMIDNWGEGVH